MSAPNPGDILPLWQPEIPGEEIQAGRLGIRVRPGSPAAQKLAIIPGGSEWLRQALEVRGEIEGTYTVSKPEKPLEFTGQVDSTLLTGRRGHAGRRVRTRGPAPGGQRRGPHLPRHRLADRAFGRLPRVPRHDPGPGPGQHALGLLPPLRPAARRGRHPADGQRRDVRRAE